MSADASIADLCAYAVRGSLVAEPGNKLVVADLSNIEGRVLAWLAGEQWKLDAFAAYDRGEGPEIYKVTASSILGKPVESITYDDRQRFGKTPELAFGFGGAVGAFRKLGGAMAEAMSDEEIVEIVRPWRARHPQIKRLWYALEEAARAAINEPGASFTVGYLTFDLKTDDYGLRWLRLRLPSGRYICYLNPDTGYYACPVCDGEGVADGATCYECKGEGALGTGDLTYEGTDQITKQWGSRYTYGGSLVENSCQAVARDIFFHGFELAEAAGYEVVLRVHDELVCEVPDTDDYSAEHLSSLMATLPGWATGLPLAAAGFTCYRYYKG